MIQSSDQLQQGPHEASRRLVLLHGWGADADDLLDLGELLAGPDVSVIALRAPQPHPFGVGRQWYGLQPIDWQALPAARQDLRERLQALSQTVALEHTVLLGFSQGGAMAVDVGTQLPLAGIVACSGYPHEGWQPSGSMPAVLLSHGLEDPVVPYDASVELQQRLQAAGAAVTLLPFPGGHTIGETVLPALRTFIQDQLHASAPDERA